MATDKPKRGSKSKKQPGHIVRVREELYVAVEKRAAAEYTTPTGWINRLIRRGLEQDGDLPPSKPDRN